MQDGQIVNRHWFKTYYIIYAQNLPTVGPTNNALAGLIMSQTNDDSIFAARLH